MLTAMRKPVTLTLLAAMTMAGCGSSRPIIDTGAPGFDAVAYQQHLVECQGFADEVEPGRQAVQSALLGAAILGALGAVVGSIDGQVGAGAAIGASTGGVVGGVQGAGDAYERRDRVLRNCLTNRGYLILD